jgi:ankyrin repeat protein
VTGGEHGSPLMAAIEHGHNDAAACLLDAGALINQHDPKVLNDIVLKSFHRTLSWLVKHGALVQAARRNHEPNVKILLKSRANVSAADKDGWTPLYWAVRNGHEPIMKMLLDGGANVSIANNDGLTPLCWAVRYGHESLVKMLLDGGAKADSTGSRISTPFELAIRYGRE